MQKAPIFCLLLLLTACATPQGQNQYNFDEVGQSTLVEFGTVISARNVGITGQNSGAGALVGAGAGLGGASYVGSGDGAIWAMAGGAIVGAIAGSALEQAAANSTGVEYVVTTEHGKTMTVVQNMNKGDLLLNAGQRVMVQTSGSYQRVLPADSLPTEIKRPKGIKVVD
jgi:outer membrane lipoprotein SlyB